MTIYRPAIRGFLIKPRVPPDDSAALGPKLPV
jgi:hypothetical protein